MVDSMAKNTAKLVDELQRERALFIQFEEIERKREAEAMTSIEGKANALIDLFASYRRPA